jgi:hypothetical protein
MPAKTATKVASSEKELIVSMALATAITGGDVKKAIEDAKRIWRERCEMPAKSAEKKAEGETSSGKSDPKVETTSTDAPITDPIDPPLTEEQIDSEKSYSTIEDEAGTSGGIGAEAHAEGEYPPED